MAAEVVIYDACVLYPAGLRSVLMYLGLTKLFRARWTEAIHDEWTRNVLAGRHDITSAQLNRTRQLMNDAIPDSVVRGYEHLIEGLSLPDANDRHILAAAIHSQANVIVTFNIKDFPASALSPHGIKACTPDQFIVDLLDTYPDAVLRAFRIDRESKKRPPKSPEEYLEALAKHKLSRTVELLRRNMGLL